ncbi:MAG: hypothetical protein MUC88_20545 [Planctomycetes bacterium]|nr:hypothetical protein [Planctomycetota bacterium]
MILLLWVYHASLILLLGAELTQACAYLVGQEIVPNEFAAGDPETAKTHPRQPERERELVHAGSEQP